MFYPLAIALGGLGGLLGVVSQHLPLAPIWRSLVAVCGGFVLSWHVSFILVVNIVTRRSTGGGIGAVSAGYGGTLVELVILLGLATISALLHSVVGRSSHLARYREVLFGVLGGLCGSLPLAWHLL